MGFRIPSLVSVKRRSSSNGSHVASTVADVPKGYLAVYEEVCNPCFLPQPAFIPKVVKPSWRRIRIRSSNRRTYHTLRRRRLHRSCFPLEFLMLRMIDIYRWRSLTKAVKSSFYQFLKAKNVKYHVKFFPWGLNGKCL